MTNPTTAMGSSRPTLRGHQGLLDRLLEAEPRTHERTLLIIKIKLVLLGRRSKPYKGLMSRTRKKGANKYGVP